MQSIHLYTAKNYKYNPIIIAKNLINDNLAFDGYIYTEFTQINTDRYLHKYNILSGNGYRGKFKGIVPNPETNNNLARKAIISENIVGSLIHIDIVKGVVILHH